MTRILSRTVLLLLVFAARGLAQAPAPAPAPAQPPFTIGTGVNTLTVGARAQFRWTLDMREQGDADTAGVGVGVEDGASSQFDVPRMRVTLNGGVYRAWMRYLFQFDFSRTGGEGASKIKDAILEIRPTGTTFRIQAGQFKVPFGMQQLNSSGRLQFVDRAITDAKFSPARDMGVAFSGAAIDRKVGYDVGLFNGAGEGIRQNNRSHLWVGRVYYEPFGAYALAEGSSDAGERAILHLGVAARGGKAIRGRTVATTVDDADNQQAIDVEFALKAPRFYSTIEHFWMTDEQRNPVVGPDIHSRGFHAQAGYMIVPRRVETSLLFGRIDADTRVDDAELTEVRGALVYYWQSHNLKLQSDVGRIGFARNFSTLPARARQGLPALGTRLVTGQHLADTQMRVQLQLAF